MDNYYILIKLGELKYSKLKAVSILHKEINALGLSYTLSDALNFLNAIMLNTPPDSMNYRIKYAVDKIFMDNEYEEHNINDAVEQNFPENWIAPTG